MPVYLGPLRPFSKEEWDDIHASDEQRTTGDAVYRVNTDGTWSWNYAELNREIKPLIGGPSYSKRTCSYCHGYTLDDDYGHCCACGGPRVF